MTDFCDKFRIDANNSASEALETVKLTEQPRIIRPFTTDCASVQTHFLETGDFRGYLQCNVDAEGACLLCDIKHSLETKLVLPIYDVEADSVKALLVSDARSPHSLGPQLRTEIDKGDLDGRLLFISRRFAKYQVHSAPMPDGAESGETAIAGFLGMIEEGRISLESAIPTMLNSGLLEIPEILRKATAMDLNSKYSKKSASASTANV